MLDVCLLGTGGMMPLPDRWLSSVLLRVNGQMLLLDCGEGTQISQKILGWGFKELAAICMSHYHADHVAGLPGMLLMVGNSGRTEPLTVFGPPGLGAVLAGLRTVAPELPYQVQSVCLRGGETVECSGTRLSALAVDHAIPCLAYRVEVLRGPEFLPEQAQALQVPVSLWKCLQRGEPVEWNGRRVEPDQVLGPPRPGLRLVYVTDTRPTPELPAFVGQADLFICEATFGDDQDLPKAVERKHMVFAEAAEVARAAGVRRLWLTHFSPSLREPERYLENARSIFPRAELGQDRMQARLTFTVPAPKSRVQSP